MKFVKHKRLFFICGAVLLLSVLSYSSITSADQNSPKVEIVSFQNGNLKLKGELYKPIGVGPFPVVLYNHGSAPGMQNSQASAIIGPKYVEHGWAFFMPYRRGQGLSEKAGPYIVDQIEAAEKAGGEAAGAATMVRILEGDHFSDQMAALAWLKKQNWVHQNRIAVAGNSFGGIETIFAIGHEKFCGAIDASGGAESWGKAPALQKILKESAHNAHAPVFFFQAENDFDLSPSKVLSAEMKSAGKESEVKIYPPFGKTPREGHSFAYRGTDIWFEDVVKFLKRHCG